MFRWCENDCRAGPNWGTWLHKRTLEWRTIKDGWCFPLHTRHLPRRHTWWIMNLTSTGKIESFVTIHYWDEKVRVHDDSCWLCFKIFLFFLWCWWAKIFLARRSTDTTKTDTINLEKSVLFRNPDDSELCDIVVSCREGGQAKNVNGTNCSFLERLIYGWWKSNLRWIVDDRKIATRRAQKRDLNTCRIRSI